jgi:predicted 3-demethylubiquinone-9 3-methyltransferase (glyoxalase superfamily)
MKGITPTLWFETQAEEAAKYYVSIFKNSNITSVTRYGAAGAAASGMPAGSVLTVAFELDGQEFVALNGGPVFKFTEAVSFMVNCEDQEEVDYYWEKLTRGGDEKAQICGWLKDKFGLSWQVVPIEFQKMMGDENPEKVERAMKVMLSMKKLDIAALKRAFEGT